jgi:hypothetical protein
MEQIIVKRSQLVEFQINGTPAVGRKYTALEIPNISRNNITVYGVEVFNATQLATTPNNNTVIAAANTHHVVLTLVDNNNLEFIYQMPIYSLVRSLNGGFIIPIQPRILNLTRSYIQLNGAGSLADGQVVAVNLYYDLIGE